MRLAELARIAMRFAEASSRAEEESCARRGEAISCGKGCGACCRQVVPVSGPEAWMLADLVANLPVERKNEVCERFRDAQTALAESGLGEAPLLSRAMEYFSLGIPCPFLQDECCSIHPERPAACREYLVTSPSRLCKDPAANSIAIVPMPFRISDGLSVLAGKLLSGGPIMIPLIRALDWAAGHEEDARREWDGHYLIEQLKTLER